MIFEKHTKLSYKYENDTFGVKDFSGESYKENTRIYCKSVKKYPETEQLTLYEYIYQFKRKPVQKARGNP